MTGYSTGIFPTTAGQGGGGGGPTFVPDFQNMFSGGPVASTYGSPGGAGDETVYLPVFRAGALTRIRTNVTVNTLTAPATIEGAVNGIGTGFMVGYLAGELGTKSITLSAPLAVRSRIAVIITPGVGVGAISVSSGLEYQPS